MFFSLPASHGFLLAGGAALAAQKLTTRPTQDLDFFTGTNSGDVPAARDAFEAAALSRGWSVRRVRDTATFCRIVVTNQEDLLIDLALDAPPNLPPTASIAGPTFDPEELAGRKIIALFDRAEHGTSPMSTFSPSTTPSHSCLLAQPKSTLDLISKCSATC